MLLHNVLEITLRWAGALKVIYMYGTLSGGSDGHGSSSYLGPSFTLH